MDYFIEAIQDPELKHILMQKEPSDIRSAVVIAKKFEEIQLATLHEFQRHAQKTCTNGQGNEENNHIRELHEARKKNKNQTPLHSSNICSFHVREQTASVEGLPRYGPYKLRNVASPYKKFYMFSKNSHFFNFHEKSKLT